MRSPRSVTSAARSVKGRLAVVACVALLGTAACVTPPLTRPVTLAAPVDALAALEALLGTPPPDAATAAELADLIADALVADLIDTADCELIPAADIIWREPHPVAVPPAPQVPTKAAIELRFGCDDALAGTWYEVELVEETEDSWVLAAASSREICKRDSDGTVCV